MALSNLELQNLFNGCRDDNRQQERLFFDWLKEFAANICYRYASSEIEGQDLVCDAFVVKVFKNLHSYNEEIYECNEAALKDSLIPSLVNITPTVGISSATANQAEIAITNLQGIVVKRISVNINNGVTVLPVDVSNLAKGNYVLTVINRATDIKTTRFAKL